MGVRRETGAALAVVGVLIRGAGHALGAWIVRRLHPEPHQLQEATVDVGALIVIAAGEVAMVAERAAAR